MSITPTKKPVETQRTSTALEAYRFLGDGKNAASLKQIRAALSFAYKHWDLKNPFAKIEPSLHKEPQIRYLLLSEIRRLLHYLKSRRQGLYVAMTRAFNEGTVKPLEGRTPENTTPTPLEDFVSELARAYQAA
jgi:hypothetical protein